MIENVKWNKILTLKFAAVIREGGDQSNCEHAINIYSFLHYSLLVLIHEHKAAGWCGGQSDPQRVGQHRQ